nr:glycosyltransferase family 4 protein [Marinobacter bryozoorum]
MFSEIFPPVHGGSGRWFSEIYGRFPEGSAAFLVGDHEQAQHYDAGIRHPVYRENLSSPEWGVRSWKGFTFYLGQWRRLRQVVRKEAVTRVHCGRVLPEGVPALLLNFTNRIPFSCYVHGEDVETVLASRELTWLTRQVMRHAEQIICNSENSRRILEQKWQLPKDKILVMTPGVDVDRFAPDHNAPRPESWGDRPVILTVGRLQKRKGQDMMIRALPALREKWPDILYAIIGGGKEWESLHQLARELDVSDHVLFMGEVDDLQMVNAYRHCSLFALPNRRVGNDDEGFGMVLLEAQACGKAVLAGNSGGTRETMREGETGKIVDCTREDALADAVSKMLGNEQRLQAMGESARSHVVEQFCWTNLATKAYRFFYPDSGQSPSG